MYFEFIEAKSANYMNLLNNLLILVNNGLDPIYYLLKFGFSIFLSGSSFLLPLFKIISFNL